MNPRSILFVSPEASQTGAPILLLRFLRWFRENHQIPFRILFKRGGPLLPEFMALGPVDVFEPKQPLPYRVARRMGWQHTPDYSRHHADLQKRLLAANVGLVYSNTIVNGEVLDYLAFLECPVLCHVHELARVIQIAGARNLESVKAATTTYIAVADVVKSNLVESCAIAEPDVHLIRGFIDTNSLAAANPGNLRRQIRKELGCPDDAFLVCGCGSIESRKGTDLFLEIAAQVSIPYGESVHFAWIGGQPDQVRTMRREAKSLGVDRIVHVTGHRDDVSTYFAASDVFLLTSREDPFPLVMLEAALQGLPVICFDGTGGAPEFVLHDAGIVVPELSATMMANSLVQLLRSESTRKAMGSVARQRVISEHSTDAVSHRISSLIKQALVRNQHDGKLSSINR